MISWKVLQKAVEAKDFNFLAAKLSQKLRELGWSDEDIVRLAEKLSEQKR